MSGKEDSSTVYASLSGGGEMGERIRQFDWAQTSLGAPDQWPPSLHTTLSILLGSRFPMFLFWGPELLCFYNDAYRPSLGIGNKHPFALGKPGDQIWPEIWPIIKPQIDLVLAGEATWHENSPGAFLRNGRLENSFWTYSYSPVRDAAGLVAGVFVTCVETTQAVENSAQLQQTNHQLQQLIGQNQLLSQEEQAAQRSLQKAVDLAQLGIWKVDIATQHATFSQQVTDWVGVSTPLTLQDAIGAIEPEDLPGFLEAYNRVQSIESGGQLDVEYRLKNYRTGQVYLLHSMGQMEFDDAGRHVLLSGFSRNMTQIRANQLELENQVHQLTQELLQANQELHRSNASLQQFAYVASHDLQEPLRKIQSFSSLLTEQYGEQLEETGQNFLERMNNAADRMSTLIRDLLAFSRISTHQKPFGSVALTAIVTDVLSTLDWQIQQTRARIQVDALPAVQGDSSQLSQLFQNLLTNALKFVRPGQIPEVRIHYVRRARTELPPDVRPATQTDFYHQISVHDQGVGFDNKYRDRIFQVFQRLHGKNQFPGTGVGLAICQRVVENHGGGITADGKPGEGATFCLYLPVL